MNSKTFLWINAILFVPFGIGMILMPGILFPIFGVNLDADGILMARVFGSALMNFGWMCYFIRESSLQSVGVRAILVSNFIFHALDAITTFISTYTGVMNSLGWMFSGLHFVLAIGFLYFLRGKEEKVHTSPIPSI